MIDVGDDGDIANIILHKQSFLGCKDTVFQRESVLFVQKNRLRIEFKQCVNMQSRLNVCRLMKCRHETRWE